jgi:hypothetical protein
MTASVVRSSCCRNTRTRLIANVVIGQRDVGGASANLANETEQLDELDDITGESDTPDWAWAARNECREANRE